MIDVERLLFRRSRGPARKETEEERKKEKITCEYPKKKKKTRTRGPLVEELSCIESAGKNRIELVIIYAENDSLIA